MKIILFSATDGGQLPNHRGVGRARVGSWQAWPGSPPPPCTGPYCWLDGQSGGGCCKVGLGWCRRVMWWGSCKWGCGPAHWSTEGVRKGSGKGRRLGLERETKTCRYKETQPTDLWYKRAATFIGCDVNKHISHLCIIKN